VQQQLQLYRQPRYNIQVLQQQDRLVIDGIEFSSCAIIKISKDSHLSLIKELQEAFVVAKELYASQLNPGRFLTFTNPSGIADDGGWSGVDVVHEGGNTKWCFTVNSSSINVEFNRKLYCDEIARVQCELSRLPPQIDVEPTQIIYPEDW